MIGREPPGGRGERKQENEKIFTCTLHLYPRSAAKSKGAIELET